MRNLFPIICTVLILVGGASSLIYFTQPEEPVVVQCDMQCYEKRFQETNNRLDGVEKALVSLQEEKEALLKEREAIQLEVIKIFKLQTDSEVEQEHWTREPGQITEDGSQQVMPPVDETITESHERFKSIASSYWLDPSLIWETENHHGIKEWVILCIAIAETSGWKFWAGKNNIGNVGNTDSNPRGQSYSNVWASLDAIGRTLTNGYIGPKKTLGCLSNAGHCTEPNDNGKRYATSDGNRERNMVACLAQIYNTTIDPSTFNIRK